MTMEPTNSKVSLTKVGKYYYTYDFIRSLPSSTSLEGPAIQRSILSDAYLVTDCFSKEQWPAADEDKQYFEKLGFMGPLGAPEVGQPNNNGLNGFDQQAAMNDKDEKINSLTDKLKRVEDALKRVEEARTRSDNDKTKLSQELRLVNAQFSQMKAQLKEREAQLQRNVSAVQKGLGDPGNPSRVIQQDPGNDPMNSNRTLALIPDEGGADGGGADGSTGPQPWSVPGMLAAKSAKKLGEFALGARNTFGNLPQPLQAVAMDRLEDVLPSALKAVPSMLKGLHGVVTDTLRKPSTDSTGSIYSTRGSFDEQTPGLLPTRPDNQPLGIGQQSTKTTPLPGTEQIPDSTYTGPSSETGDVSSNPSSSYAGKPAAIPVQYPLNPAVDKKEGPGDFKASAFPSDWRRRRRFFVLASSVSEADEDEWEDALENQFEDSSVDKLESLLSFGGLTDEQLEDLANLDLDLFNEEEMDLSEVVPEGFRLAIEVWDDLDFDQLLYGSIDVTQLEDILYDGMTPLEEIFKTAEDAKLIGAMLDKDKKEDKVVKGSTDDTWTLGTSYEGLSLDQPEKAVYAVKTNTSAGLQTNIWENFGNRQNLSVNVPGTGTGPTPADTTEGSSGGMLRREPISFHANSWIYAGCLISSQFFDDEKKYLDVGFITSKEFNTLPEYVTFRKYRTTDELESHGTIGRFNFAIEPVDKENVHPTFGRRYKSTLPYSKIFNFEVLRATVYKWTWDLPNGEQSYKYKVVHGSVTLRGSSKSKMK
jgi:hypothetical protein